MKTVTLTNGHIMYKSDFKNRITACIKHARNNGLVIKSSAVLNGYDKSYIIDSEDIKNNNAFKEYCNRNRITCHISNSFLKLKLN